MKKISVIIFCISAMLSKLNAQDDLLKMLDAETFLKRDYATATFKATRLINGHSVENAAPGVLDFKISHRFGMVNKGTYELFGLDQATMRIGFDYGINKKLNIGIGRSTFQKQYDGFIKYKILQQSNGGKWSSPVTVSAVSTIMLKTLKSDNPVIKQYYNSRISYAHQLLLARKFNKNLSLQLMPSFVHYNLVQAITEPNDVFAMGIGGRIKLNKRISFNAEYYPVMPINATESGNYRLAGTKNSIAIGFDIETGGHVFQLHFTNSTGMTEKTFVTETTGNFFKGDIHFGFNVSRVFTVNNKKRK